MSGRGGRGSDRGVDASSLADSIKQTQQKAHDVELAQLFAETLRQINQIDTAALNQHKQTVLDALTAAFDEVADLDTGGSRSRHTFVNGLSDVDLLAVFGPYSSCTLSNKESKDAVLNDMAACLRQRLPQTDISPGRMAVTIRFSDGQELQVLPAFRYHSGYRVPDPHGSGWTITRPQVFAKLLRDRNTELGGKLLRTIKLGKLICANAGVDIKSYHLENMAIKAFERYTGTRSDVSMLTHLFNQAKTIVARPMRDITGQERYIDSYLKSDAARSRLARSLAAVEQKIVAVGNNPDAWQELLKTS